MEVAHSKSPLNIYDRKSFYRTCRKKKFKSLSFSRPLGLLSTIPICDISKEALKGRHDTQHKDIQHNDNHPKSLDCETRQKTRSI
jgi:hypothetical protein